MREEEKKTEKWNRLWNAIQDNTVIEELCCGHKIPQHINIFL